MNKKLVALGIGLILISALALTGSVEAKEWSIKLLNSSVQPRLNYFYTLHNSKVYYSFANVDPSGFGYYNIQVDDVSTLWDISTPTTARYADGIWDTDHNYMWMVGEWDPDGCDDNQPPNPTIGKWNENTWIFSHEELSSADDRGFVTIVEKNSTHFLVGEQPGEWNETGFYTEGGFIWSIPRSTWDDTSTWTNLWHQPDNWEIKSLINFNNTVYALAVNHTFSTAGDTWHSILYSDFKIYRFNETTQGFDEIYYQDDKSVNALPNKFFIEDNKLMLIYPYTLSGSDCVHILHSSDGTNFHTRSTGAKYVRSTDHELAPCDNNNANVAGYVRNGKASIYAGYGGNFKVWRYDLETDVLKLIRTFSGSNFAIKPDNGYDTTNDKFYFISYDPAGGFNGIFEEGMHNMTTVNIYAKDDKTKETISEFQATLDGRVKNTTTGTITFYDVPDGTHELKVISDDYRVTKTYITTDWISNDTISETVYLISYPSGAGVEYPPHYVEFKTLKYSWIVFSNPVSGVDVNVSGLSKNATNISMNGTTGSDGSVGFEMRQDIKYRIDFSKGNWSDSLVIYPTDDYYQIYVSGIGETEPSMHGTVNWNLTTEEINDTARYFNLSYNDTSGKTDHLGFYVFDGSKKLIYSKELTGTSVYNFSTIVEDYVGKDYYTKFNATYKDNYFDPVKTVKGYSFPKDMSFGLSQKWLNIISIALLFLTGSLFSAVTIKVGAVIVPGFAWLLHWIGWLNYTGAAILISTAFVLGALYYMTQKEREAGI